MRNIEELAKEYVFDVLNSHTSNGYQTRDAFIAGYNKAKEWISVEDALPEENIGVLVKSEINSPITTHLYKSDIDGLKKWAIIGDFANNITHWKYID